jgi:Deacetylase PdaC
MKKLVLAALTGALLLTAGCQKKVRDLSDVSETSGAVTGEDSEAAVMDVATIASVDELPREIIIDEPYLKAEVTIDEAVFAKAPAIGMDLVENAQIRIEAMSADAQEYQKADPTYFRPYGLRIKWEVVASAGNVVSLEGFHYTFTGGAHGNYFTAGRLYNGVTGEPMRLSMFLREPQAAINAHMDNVWTEIARQKVRKSGNVSDLERFRSEAMELVSPDMVLAGDVNFVPSTLPDRFGGYAVHFAPYDIGSYAEGSYHVTIPQSVFRDAVKQQYLALFDGEPVAFERLGE